MTGRDRLEPVLFREKVHRLTVYTLFEDASPQELEDLNLTALHLSGNSFSGCIPSGLRDVETNDLNLLGLDYCTSPES